MLLIFPGERFVPPWRLFRHFGEAGQLFNIDRRFGPIQPEAVKIRIMERLPSSSVLRPGDREATLPRCFFDNCRTKKWRPLAAIFLS